MTSIQTPRPPASPAPRPGGPTPPGAAPGTVVVDPIKLARKYKWQLIVALFVGIGLGVGAHYALLRLYPIWTAGVVWECLNADRKLGEALPEHTSRDELEKFMATQAQIMMSSTIVEKAAVHPDIQREVPAWRQRYTTGSGGFDQAAAVRELEKRVRAGVMGETQLVRLSYWSNDKGEAAAIANIVAEAYLADRRARVESEQYDRREQLTASIADAEKKIVELQDKRRSMIEQYKVESLNDQINKVQGTILALTERLIETRASIEAATSQLQRMQAQVASPTGILYDDTMRMAADRDPVVQSIRADINVFRGELDAMNLRGILPSHLDYRSLESRLRGREESYTTEYEKALRRQFDSFMEEMKNAISALQAQGLDLVKQLEVEEGRGTELTKIRSEISDINEQIVALGDRKVKLADELENLRALGMLDSSYRIRVQQRARTPRNVTFPKLFIMIPAGIAVVMGLAVGVILLIEIVDQRVKGASDIAMISRTKVLGVVPHAAEDPAAPARVETVFRDQPSGVLAESFRQARGAIAKQLAQRGHKSLLVVAALPGSGASAVVVNLAYALAASEHRVLIIDANFRRPTISKTLGLQDAPGLADVLANGQTIVGAVQATDNPNVAVLAAGSAPNRRVERLATPAMGNLLREAGEAYDTVLIDAAPAIVAGDAVALANRCDASMLVVRAFAEKRGMVARLRNELGECRAEFLGVLVNGVRSSSGGYLRGNIRATHQYQNGNA